jgi:hypothetical protein
MKNSPAYSHPLPHHILRVVLLLALSIAVLSCEKTAESLSSGGGEGKNGSLSRVITVGQHIYAVDDRSLRTVNAADPTRLQLTDETTLGNAIQTIFHDKGRLYIGSAMKMHIYDISANPSKPTHLSTFDYPIVIEPRDPILAFDTVIYATVTSGFGSGAFRIFNNRDVRNPQLVGTIDLPQPRGMARVDTTLYLCDGAFGLRIFDIRKPLSPTLLRTVDENRTLTGGQPATNDYFDAIAVPPMLFCYTRGALLSYDISIPRSPAFLGKMQ